MALILSLDSTSLCCSVAIHRNGELIGNETSEEPRTAASQLAIMIRDALSKAAISPKELSAVAISSGPGSYTGLRIATSTAKGLCFALRVPLIAVGSLLVLTNQLINKVEADIFCPMLDARRMEVYYALVNSKLEFIKPVEAKILTGSSFEHELNYARIAFFGDGSDKFKKLVNHNNSIFVDSIYPRAIDLGFLAYDKFRNGNFEDVDFFEPYYLKDFMIKK